MAATCITRPVGLTQRTAFLASKPAPATPRCRHCLTVARCSTTDSQLQATVSKAVCLGTAAATMLAADNANAAQEIAQLAASDNRVGIIATLFLPVVGWVGYNIAGPAINQLANISEKREGGGGKKPRLALKKRAIVSALVGLSAASLLATPQAEAATEAFQLAASDNRLGIIATLFLPVVGWVGYNIGGPALNQLANISDKRDGGGARKPRLALKKRSVAAGLVGLSAASLLATPQAEAATEAFQLAAGDNRLAIIATLFLPVVGWVLFNIGGPALNQLANISEKREGSPIAKASKALRKRR